MTFWLAAASVARVSNLAGHEILAAVIRSSWLILWCLLESIQLIVPYTIYSQSYLILSIKFLTFQLALNNGRLMICSGIVWCGSCSTRGWRRHWGGTWSFPKRLLKLELVESSVFLKTPQDVKNRSEFVESSLLRTSLNLLMNHYAAFVFWTSHLFFTPSTDGLMGGFNYEKNKRRSSSNFGKVTSLTIPRQSMCFLFKFYHLDKVMINPKGGP